MFSAPFPCLNLDWREWRRKEMGRGRGRGKGEEEGLIIWAIEPKLRPHLRYLVRRVQGQGNGAERAEEEGISPLFHFPFINYSVWVPAIRFSFVLEVVGGKGWVVHID
jgi:hypothetical protein